MTKTSLLAMVLNTLKNNKYITLNNAFNQFLIDTLILTSNAYYLLSCCIGKKATPERTFNFGTL